MQSCFKCEWRRPPNSLQLEYPDPAFNFFILQDKKVINMSLHKRHHMNIPLCLPLACYIRLHEIYWSVEQANRRTKSKETSDSLSCGELPHPPALKPLNHSPSKDFTFHNFFSLKIIFKAFQQHLQPGWDIWESTNLRKGFSCRFSSQVADGDVFKVGHKIIIRHPAFVKA